MNITIPEYVGQGLLELFILIVGGLLVGWITYTYFARRAAIVEVEGEVMKKRLCIYEELYKRLNSFEAQEMLPAARLDAAYTLLHESGFDVASKPYLPTLSIMATAKGFSDAYFELDSYISRHRLYFETELDRRLIFFTNYLAIFRRLQVMFEEQIIDMHLPIDDAAVVRCEDQLMTQLCILYQDEFSDEITKVLDAIRTAIHTPQRHKRKPQDHSHLFFGDGGTLHAYLEQLLIFRQREQIPHLIASNIALAKLSQSR